MKECKRAQAQITLQSNKGGVIRYFESRKTLEPASDLNSEADSTAWRMHVLVLIDRLCSANGGIKNLLIYIAELVSVLVCLCAGMYLFHSFIALYGFLGLLG